MQYAPYQFFYLRSHKTKDLIKKYLGELDKTDEDQIYREIGQFLYQFQIKDKYSSWTVMKTSKQIKTFFDQRQNAKSSFEIKMKMDIDLKKPEELQNTLKEMTIKQGTPGQIPKYMKKFFEIYSKNIRKITSFQMQKKVRGLTRLKKVQNYLCGVKWNPKRIIVTQEGVLEMANDENIVTDFLKFDLYFYIQSGMNATGQQFGISLFSAQRKVVLKANNAKQFLQFLFYTVDASQRHKKKINFAGSCRPRQKNKINFLVDAESYYIEVALALQKAKRNVFICGWWISPQLYLIRPIKGQELAIHKYRLDNLLKRIAERGVKIYIVVFFSPSVIPNDSDHTKKALAKLHPNITVERHPHEFLPKLWSHHEKAVIIDQKVAFMGGLDLCYGRYDSKDHPVNKNDITMYPGIDYNNVRIKDFIEVSNYSADLQERNLPRMPWHDVAFKVQGKMVADVANHFIEYWNFTLLEKSMKPIVSKRSKEEFEQTKQIINPKNKGSNDLILGIIKLAIEGNQSANKKEKQLMSSHVENRATHEKEKIKIRSQRLKNKFFSLNNGPGQFCLVLSIESLGLLKQDSKYNQKNKQRFQDELQLLRSASQWSIGLQNGVTERSIQNAYLKLIKEAKSFIYIENQFFISATGDHANSFVKNQIANSLYERIKKAIEKNQKFKVVVFMPLLPGMEGQLNEKCPFSLKLTMFWQFNTISQCKDSLLSRVKLLTDRPQDYIEFFSLRNHGVLQQQPVTQIIYIHSKLMIVDDDIVLCGSANINDRSQEGFRDSELAVIFTKGSKAQKRMNGVKRQVNESAHKLRAKLFRQHFKLDQQEVEDPLSDILIQKMRTIAKTNTQSYRELFGCCPDDNVKKLADVKDFQKKTPMEKYLQISKNIHGHAVYFPTMFLSEQKLYKYDLDMVQDIFT